jgi:hypothetical protein
VCGCAGRGGEGVGIDVDGGGWWAALDHRAGIVGNVIDHLWSDRAAKESLECATRVCLWFSKRRHCECECECECVAVLLDGESGVWVVYGERKSECSCW